MKWRINSIVHARNTSMLMLAFQVLLGLHSWAEGPGPGPLRPRDTLRLNITQDSLVIEEGNSFQLMAIISPPSQEKHFILWETRDDEVVRLMNYGELFAKKPGITYVVAYDYFNQELRDTCVVTVKRRGSSDTIPKPRSRLIISHDTLVMYVDDNSQLMASVVPPTASQAQIVWECLGETILWLGQFGYVSAIKEGKALIVARDEKNKQLSDTCVVFVLHRKACNEGNFPTENKTACLGSLVTLFSDNPKVKWYRDESFQNAVGEGSSYSFTYNNDTSVSIFQTIQLDTCLVVQRKVNYRFEKNTGFDSLLLGPFKEICVDSSYQLPYDDIRWYSNENVPDHYYIGSSFPPGIAAGLTIFHVDRASSCDNKRLVFPVLVEDCAPHPTSNVIAFVSDTMRMYVGDRQIVPLIVKPEWRQIQLSSLNENVVSIESASTVVAAGEGQSLVVARDIIDTTLADTCLVIVKHLRSCGNNDFISETTSICTATSWLIQGINSKGALWYNNSQMTDPIGIGHNNMVYFAADTSVVYYQVARADTCLQELKRVELHVLSPKNVDVLMLDAFDTLCIDSSYQLPYTDLQWYSHPNDHEPSSSGNFFPGGVSVGDTVFYLGRSSSCERITVRFDVNIRDCRNDFVPAFLVSGRLSQFFSVTLPPMGVVLYDNKAQTIDSIVCRDGNFVLKVPRKGYYTIKAQPLVPSDYITTFYGNKPTFESARLIPISSYVKGIDIKMLTRQLLSESTIADGGVSIEEITENEILITCEGCPRESNIAIVNIEGKEMASLKTSFPVSIQTSNWPNGTYIISVKNLFPTKTWVKY